MYIRINLPKGTRLIAHGIHRNLKGLKQDFLIKKMVLPQGIQDLLISLHAVADKSDRALCNIVDTAVCGSRHMDDLSFWNLNLGGTPADQFVQRSFSLPVIISTILWFIVSERGL